MKPIDFIPNPIIDDVFFISDNCLDIAYLNSCNEYKHDYEKYKDEKYNKFCEDHNLSKHERLSDKWYDIYLEMCSIGLI